MQTLASQQCGLHGFNNCTPFICGLSLVLLLVRAHRGFFLIRECSLFMGRGGGLANGRGGKQSLLRYLGGGGSERFCSVSGKEGGGGQKSLKVDIISFGFF